MNPLYKILKYRRFLNNKTALLSICSNFIDLFEEEINRKKHYDSCKEPLMKELTAYISSDFNSIAVLDEKNDNFTELAVASISTVSFNFFDYHMFSLSGKYSSYRYCSSAMYAVHEKAVQWGVDHGFITEEEKKEDALALRDTFRYRV